MLLIQEESKLQQRQEIAPSINWIRAWNSAVIEVLGKCVKCKRHCGNVEVKTMAELPTDRLIPDEATLTRVGVYIFGAFEIKQGRSLVKRHGVVFTYMLGYPCNTPRGSFHFHSY